MEDPKTIQANLDHAQEDLERDVSDLKHVVQEKLEGPKHVIAAIEQPLKFIRRHAVWFGVGAVVLLAALVTRKALED